MNYRHLLLLSIKNHENECFKIRKIFNILYRCTFNKLLCLGVSTLDIKSIVDGLENFYDVWSDGVSGNVIEVQKKLADLETISIQTAKNIIKEPKPIRCQSSKNVAEEEIKHFEGTGLKCKLVHVGPELLDQYTNDEIEQFLHSMNKGIDTFYISAVKPRTYALFSGSERIFVNYDEVEFFLYLSCLRYLALKGRVK